MRIAPSFLLLFAIALSPFPASAAGNGEPSSADTLVDSLMTVELPEIGVNGRRASSARRNISQTAVYDRSQRIDVPVSTIESALRQSPAIDVRERGARGVQADICIRGGSFDQTMVMLNGVNFTDARTGHQSHSLPVDLTDVAAIEVIDGVSGVGAYAGAVDIRTAPLHPRYLSASLAAGSFGYVDGSLSGSWTAKGLSVMAAGSARRSDGYIHNTAYANYNAYARARYDCRAGLFDAQAGYQNRSFGANGFYSRAFPDQYEHTTTALASLQWQRRTRRLNIAANIGYRYNTDRFELIRNHPDQVPYNYHITHNISAEAAAAYDWGTAGETQISVDMMHNYILSTVLGDPCKPHNIGGIDYNHSKRRTTINAILRHTLEIRALTVSGAGGVSHSPYGTDGLWSAGASLALSSHWRIGAGAVESMRLPTFTDLYYTAKGYEADRNLVPEHAITAHISAGYTSGPWSAECYAYYRRGRNVIDWVRFSPDDNWHSMQVTKINTYGAEITAAYTPGTWLRRAAISYGHVYQNSRAAKDIISTYAFDHMRNKAALTLDLTPFSALPALSLSVTGTLYDRCGNYAADGKIVSYRPYFLLDAKLQYTIGAFTIFADATNITCTRYFDFGGLAMPRIWPTAGLTLTLK